LDMRVFKVSQIERFWNNVDKSGECWLWTRSVGPAGYGQLGVWTDGKNKAKYAHRHAYELSKGEIPDGMHVCHTCDNKLCVRPDHLTVGSPYDNALDRTRKGRGARKLTPDIVRDIRARLDDPDCVRRRVAEEFGVTPQAISHISSRRTWAWLL
jgi:hypothetical protein